MKIVFKTLSLLAIVSVGIFMLVFYQSCKPQRNCFLLKGFRYFELNSSTQDTIQNLDSVKFSHLNLRIIPDYDGFSCQVNTPWTFVNTASATKIQIDQIYHDTIKNITITSNQSFDSLHPAGSSLNDLFVIPVPVNSVSAGFGMNYDFLLAHAPDSERFHQLRVTIDMVGTIPYDTVFPPIKILK